ncbi:MAG: hypothetical protein ACK40D_06345 [Cyanobacteriota bacterium]|jgi:hypothetical protein
MTSQRHAATGPSWLEGLSWLLLAASGCFLLFSLVVYGLGEPLSNLGFIHPMRMKPPFADLRYLTANSECGVNLDDYYKGLVVGCDPAGRTYRFDYPPMSIWLGRFLRVRGSHTPWIAITTAFALLISILGLVRDQVASSWKWRVLGSAMLMSFPLHQALERGNIDVMLFLMLLLFAFLVSRPLKSFLAALPGNLLACLLTFFSVSLKIYPLFGLVGLLAARGGGLATTKICWDSARLKAMVLAAAVAGIFPLLGYFRSVGNLIKEGGLGSHGLLAFGYMNIALVDSFGIDTARLLIRVLFVSKAAALLAGFWLAYKANLSWVWSRPNSLGRRLSGFQWITLLTASSVWLGCYIFTINYDYRFLYVFPFIAYLAALAAAPGRAGLQTLWPSALILMILVVLFFPWLQTGYTEFGMKSVKILEPVTEFVLIPLFAGSLFYFLLANTWLLQRRPIQVAEVSRPR